LINKKRLLITGASGLCGGYLHKHFLTYGENYEIYTTSRRYVNYKRHITHDFQEPYNNSELPLTVDYIINCAAVVNESLSAGYDLINKNLKSMFNILRYALAAKVSCFIQLSSISVYGQQSSPDLIQEQFPLKPVSPYGKSKILCEFLCRNMLSNVSRFFSLRLGYVLASQIPTRYFLSRLLKQLNDNKEIILINPDKSRFSFIDVNDIALICEKIFECSETNGIFNVIGDQNPTLRQVFNLLKEYFPGYAGSIIEKNHPEQILSTRYSNEEVKKNLNIKNFTNIEQSFKKLIKYNLNK
jgi:nucleoside-diphosphate-sugar epimerase